MLVFFSNILMTVVIVLIILTVIMSLTTIKINFKYIDKKYKMIIKLYILGKIRYFKLELNREKVNEILQKGKTKIEKRRDKKIENEIYQDRKVIKNIIKESKIDLEYLNLDLNIGTEFILLTTVIITTLSTIFPMILNKFIRKYDSKKYMYKFTPIYNRNDIKLQLDCIISIKLVHIINVILSILFKKGVFKNVRTSNTRFNDNCYE